MMSNEDGHYDAMVHTNEGNLKQELEDYKHEYTTKQKMIVKKVNTFAMMNKKCKSFRWLSV